MRVPLIVPEVQGAILAGGESRRMGKPKLFLDFRGNTFVAHLCLQLQQQVNVLMLVTRAEFVAQLRDLPLDVLADDEPDLGPLGGLVTALRHSARPWVLTTPCDNPLLSADYAARMLHAARTQQAPLVYVRKQGREQPLYAIVQRSLLPSLEAYLARGERAVLPWFTSVGAVALDWEDAGVAFDNINTPESYSAFLTAVDSAD